MNTMNLVRSFARASTVAIAAGSLVMLASCASSGTGSTNRPATMTGPNGEVFEEKYIEYHATPEDLANAKSKSSIAADNAVLYVNGMGCPLCATNIDKQLERVPGVKTVKVDLGNGQVTLGMTPGGKHPSPAVLGEAVEDAGFTLVKVEQH